MFVCVCGVKHAQVTQVNIIKHIILTRILKGGSAKEEVRGNRDGFVGDIVYFNVHEVVCAVLDLSVLPARLRGK